MYIQLKEQLLQAIESGQLRPGDQIPTERELQEQFGVSRITVRHAITELVRDGVLVRLRPKGTFVSKPKIQKWLSRISSFTEEMQQRGAQPTTKLLRLHRRIPSRNEAKMLDLPVEVNVWEVFRLRLADGEPIALQWSYVPEDLCPKLDRATLDHSQSLYAVLEAEHGLRPTGGRERYRPMLLDDKEEASLLGIPMNSPVFWVERIAYLPDGRPMEYARSLLRGDRYTLEVELQG